MLNLPIRKIKYRTPEFKIILLVFWDSEKPTSKWKNKINKKEAKLWRSHTLCVQLGLVYCKCILHNNNQMKIVFEKIKKEKNEQSMEEYRREEKESVQYQNNLIDKTFDSMLHPVVRSDRQLMQQSLHQHQRGLLWQ